VREQKERMKQRVDMVKVLYAYVSKYIKPIEIGMMGR
jgi:hypothetical protein